jgi:hypothetical protein
VLSVFFTFVAMMNNSFIVIATFRVFVEQIGTEKTGPHLNFQIEKVVNPLGLFQFQVFTSRFLQRIYFLQNLIKLSLLQF